MYKNLLVLGALLLIGIAFAEADQPQGTKTYDLVIRGGKVMDGSGAPAYTADVAILGGRIAAIGKIAVGAGKEEINASGLAIAPGFIDVHTHVDADILRSPNAENFIRDGVTTIVTGNCGGSVSDVGAYFENMKKKGSAINVATLIGHNTVLKGTKGDRAGDLTTDQMEAAKKMVRKAMEDGAVGMSTGLIYNPGQFSPMSEIIELQKVAAEYGGIYASHMRSEGAGIFKAIDEALTIGREAKCRVEISHFKVTSEATRREGGSNATLKKVLEARLAGLDVWLDQYPYTASSTTINTLVPDEFLKDGVESLHKKLASQDEVEKLVTAMREYHEVKQGRKHLGYVAIASCGAYPTYNGRNILEIAQGIKLKAEKGANVELIGLAADQMPKVSMEDQCRVVADIIAKGGASCVFHSMIEPDVENIMSSSIVSIASDSGIRQFGAGVPHPRGYGTNTRVLGVYARERKIISMEEAVRKMTSQPAMVFKMKDRGLVKDGYAADLVLFDPKTVIDRATFEKPHQYPEGMAYVLVNGVVVLEGEKMTGKLPGVPVYGPGKK